MTRSAVLSVGKAKTASFRFNLNRIVAKIHSLVKNHH